MSLRKLAIAHLNNQAGKSNKILSQRDILSDVPEGQIASNKLNTNTYGVPSNVSSGTASNSNIVSGTIVSVETARDAGTNGTFGTVGTSGTANWILLQREADRRNIKAQREHLTDRYCRCGRLAEYAWPLEGRREMWRCVDCYPVKGRL
jgi:hypothetical protein